MTTFERLGLAALRRIDPEAAHGVALRALRAGMGPRGGPLTSTRLRTTLAGLDLPNPVGLAPGFDKNAVALGGLQRAGFGWLEVGAATPRPQSGNPRPRLFRLPEDGAVINRFGFNNDGADAVADRLAKRSRSGVVGLNLGANRDSDDRAGDYVRLIDRCAPLVDFVTVNVSSPNTAGLRDLQGGAALRDLLGRVLEARDAQPVRVPVFVKVAPDLDDAGLSAFAKAANGVDAVIATNTTTDRAGLQGGHRDEAGGLSGRPLFGRSTRVLAKLSARMPTMPLVGVGGIASAEDAYAKIRAGASAVQLYTALAYDGLSLVERIVVGLDRLLARDGFETVTGAVGADRDRWS